MGNECDFGNDNKINKKKKKNLFDLNPDFKETKLYVKLGSE